MTSQLDIELSNIAYVNRPYNLNSSVTVMIRLKPERKLNVPQAHDLRLC